MTFVALGYLRKDVSRQQQRWDEAQIRSLARRLGYNLQKTVVASNRTDDPIGVLMNVVAQVDAEAVIVPTVAHFDECTVPAELVEITDVITVVPERTFARWPDGKLSHHY